jgi:malate synthase
VPLYNLMEDAATAEISRALVWQWVRHGVVLSNGKAVIPAMFRQALNEEMRSLRQALGEERWNNGHFERAIMLFGEMVTAGECPDFLTLPAYDFLIDRGG